jgi:hypothetical protein
LTGLQAASAAAPRLARPNVTMRRFCCAGIGVEKQGDATFYARSTRMDAARLIETLNPG